MTITFQPVKTAAQVKETASIAKKIWNEHFPKIIGQSQTDYMLETLQSAEAIENMIKNDGYEYFIIRKNNNPVGYTSIQKQDESLFLSKLYVQKENRGEHISTEAIKYFKQICKENHLSKIWLTVNRRNTGTIEIYEHFGFIIAKTQVADIGNGYLMDDYVMELTVS